MMVVQVVAKSTLEEQGGQLNTGQDLAICFL